MAVITTTPPSSDTSLIYLSLINTAWCAPSTFLMSFQVNQRALLIDLLTIISVGIAVAKILEPGN